MNDSVARLDVRYGTVSEQSYLLMHEATNIGREPFNDIVVNVPEVSRRHARILRQEDGYYLEDLNSTNGSFVNKQRIEEPVLLKDKDEIDIAESLGFIFAFGQVDLVAATSAVAVSSTENAAAEPAPVPDFLAAASEPPPEKVSEPPPARVAQTPEQPQRGGCLRWFVGCLLIFVFLAILCGGIAFIADAWFANEIYCGPARSYVQLVADTLNLLGFGQYQPVSCPIG